MHKRRFRHLPAVAAKIIDLKHDSTTEWFQTPKLECLTTSSYPISGDDILGVQNLTTLAAAIKDHNHDRKKQRSMMPELECL